MTNQQDEENIIEEIINRLKTNGDISMYKKPRKISGFLALMSQLNGLPKKQVPNFDFMRVKNQVLDRIAVPAADTEKAGWLVGTLPNILRIGTMVLGSVLIIISITLGTAVTALNSVPGQAIYPLKKVVENFQLQLAPKDQQSSLQIQFASNRVDELQQVLQQQQDGQISASDAQKIVSATVKDVQKTATAAANSSVQQPKPSVVTKLADLSSKLRAASVKSEGEVKIELDQAIKNIEQAGLKVEGPPIIIDDSVSAQGKLTTVNATAASIGSAKFLLTKDTQYVNTKAADLAVDQQVDIKGQIKDNKTYAQTITLIADSKGAGMDTKTNTNTKLDLKTDTSATTSTSATQ
ncbi:MAG: DUF5667 domain-containing protein [Candidatus Doudnabacteria bacterium]